jgi:hypothetical protein
VAIVIVDPAVMAAAGVIVVRVEMVGAVMAAADAKAAGVASAAKAVVIVGPGASVRAAATVRLATMGRSPSSRRRF